jgi:hypothetical protein
MDAQFAFPLEFMKPVSTFFSPRGEVELTFPSLEAAAAYARRQGLQFMVQGGAAAAASVWSIGFGIDEPTLSQVGPPAKMVERTLAPDIIRNDLGTEHDAPASYARSDGVRSDDDLRHGANAGR